MTRLQNRIVFGLGLLGFITLVIASIGRITATPPKVVGDTVVDLRILHTYYVLCFRIDSVWYLLIGIGCLGLACFLLCRWYRW